MKEKDKFEKNLMKLTTRFEKAKEQDEKKGTARVKHSVWFPQQFKAIKDELAKNEPDLGRVADGLNTIEGALKKLGVS
jgi:hypothetical protein